MIESERSTAVVAAVWIGSLLLFALPAFLATVHLVDAVLGIANLSVPPAGWLLVDAVAFLVAVQTATEIAAWRLHGGGWFRRGGRRLRAVRIAVATGICVGALTLIALATIWLVAAVATAETGGVFVAGVALAFVIAFAGSAVLTGRAFLRGYRADGRLGGRPD